MELRVLVKCIPECILILLLWDLADLTSKWGNIYIYHIWVNYNDLTVLPKPGIMVNIIGESSPR